MLTIIGDTGDVVQGLRAYNDDATLDATWAHGTNFTAYLVSDGDVMVKVVADYTSDDTIFVMSVLHDPNDLVGLKKWTSWNDNDWQTDVITVEANEGTPVQWVTQLQGTPAHTTGFLI